MTRILGIGYENPLVAAATAPEGTEFSVKDE
jgi:hypothetical protein